MADKNGGESMSDVKSVEISKEYEDHQAVGKKDDNDVIAEWRRAHQKPRRPFTEKAEDIDRFLQEFMSDSDNYNQKSKNARAFSCPPETDLMSKKQQQETRKVSQRGLCVLHPNVRNNCTETSQTTLLDSGRFITSHRSVEATKKNRPECGGENMKLDAERVLRTQEGSMSSVSNYPVRSSGDLQTSPIRDKTFNVRQNQESQRSVPKIDLKLGGKSFSDRCLEISRELLLESERKLASTKEKPVNAAVAFSNMADPNNPTIRDRIVNVPQNQESQRCVPKNDLKLSGKRFSDRCLEISRELLLESGQKMASTREKPVNVAVAFSNMANSNNPTIRDRTVNVPQNQESQRCVPKNDLKLSGKRFSDRCLEISRELLLESGQKMASTKEKPVNAAVAFTNKADSNNATIRDKTFTVRKYQESPRFIPKIDLKLGGKRFSDCCLRSPTDLLLESGPNLASTKEKPVNAAVAFSNMADSNNVTNSDKTFNVCQNQESPRFLPKIDLKLGDKSFSDRCSQSSTDSILKSGHKLASVQEKPVNVGVELSEVADQNNARMSGLAENEEITSLDELNEERLIKNPTISTENGTSPCESEKSGGVSVRAMNQQGNSRKRPGKIDVPDSEIPVDKGVTPLKKKRAERNAMKESPVESIERRITRSMKRNSDERASMTVPKKSTGSRKKVEKEVENLSDDSSSISRRTRSQTNKTNQLPEKTSNRRTQKKTPAQAKKEKDTSKKTSKTPQKITPKTARPRRRIAQRVEEKSCSPEQEPVFEKRITRSMKRAEGKKIQNDTDEESLTERGISVPSENPTKIQPPQELSSEEVLEVEKKSDYHFVENFVAVPRWLGKALKYFYKKKKLNGRKIRKINKINAGQENLVRNKKKAKLSKFSQHTKDNFMAHLKKSTKSINAMRQIRERCRKAKLRKTKLVFSVRQRHLKTRQIENEVESIITEKQGCIEDEMVNGKWLTPRIQKSSRTNEGSSYPFLKCYLFTPDRLKNNPQGVNTVVDDLEREKESGRVPPNLLGNSISSDQNQKKQAERDYPNNNFNSMNLQFSYLELQEEESMRDTEDNEQKSSAHKNDASNNISMNKAESSTLKDLPPVVRTIATNKSRRRSSAVDMSDKTFNLFGDSYIEKNSFFKVPAQREKNDMLKEFNDGAPNPLSVPARRSEMSINHSMNDSELSTTNNLPPAFKTEAATDTKRKSSVVDVSEKTFNLFGDSYVEKNSFFKVPAQQEDNDVFEGTKDSDIFPSRESETSEGKGLAGKISDKTFNLFGDSFVEKNNPFNVPAQPSGESKESDDGVLRSEFTDTPFKKNGALVVSTANGDGSSIMETTQSSNTEEENLTVTINMNCSKRTSNHVTYNASGNSSVRYETDNSFNETSAHSASNSIILNNTFTKDAPDGVQNLPRENMNEESFEAEDQTPRKVRPMRLERGYEIYGFDMTPILEETEPEDDMSSVDNMTFEVSSSNARSNNCSLPQNLTMIIDKSKKDPQSSNEIKQNCKSAIEKSGNDRDKTRVLYGSTFYYSSSSDSEASDITNRDESIDDDLLDSYINHTIFKDVNETVASAQTFTINADDHSDDNLTDENEQSERCDRTFNVCDRAVFEKKALNNTTNNETSDLSMTDLNNGVHSLNKTVIIDDENRRTGDKWMVPRCNLESPFDKPVRFAYHSTKEVGTPSNVQVSKMKKTEIDKNPERNSGETSDSDSNLLNFPFSMDRPIKKAFTRRSNVQDMHATSEYTERKKDGESGKRDGREAVKRTYSAPLPFAPLSKKSLFWSKIEDLDC